MAGMTLLIGKIVAAPTTEKGEAFAKRKAVQPKSAKPKAAKSKPGKSASVVTQQTFTFFSKMPGELRNMVWDKALDEYTVLHQFNQGTFRDKQRYQCFVRCGFNAGDIALACSEAAARWALKYPFRKIFANDRAVRFNIDRTILFSENEWALGHFLREAIHTRPRFLAVKKIWYESCYLYSSAHLPTRYINGKRVKSGVKKLFKVKKCQGRTTASIAESVLAAVKNPRDDAVVLHDRKGVEWLREITDPNVFGRNEGVEEVLDSDSEELQS